MKQKHVDIEFDDYGKPTIEVAGVHGRECLQATAAIEKALGLDNIDRTATADMAKRPERTNVRTR